MKKVVLEGIVRNLVLKTIETGQPPSEYEMAQRRLHALPSLEYYCVFEIDGRTVVSDYIETRPIRDNHLLVVVGEAKTKGDFYVEAFQNLTTDFGYDPRPTSLLGTGAAWGVCLVVVPFFLWHLGKGDLSGFNLIASWVLLVLASVTGLLLSWSYLSARAASKVLKAYLKARLLKTL